MPQQADMVAFMKTLSDCEQPPIEESMSTSQATARDATNATAACVPPRSGEFSPKSEKFHGLESVKVTMNPSGLARRFAMPATIALP